MIHINLYRYLPISFSVGFCICVFYSIYQLTMSWIFSYQIKVRKVEKACKCITFDQQPNKLYDKPRTSATLLVSILKKENFNFRQIILPGTC